MDKATKTRVHSKDIKLVEGKSTNKVLGDFGGRYWHIYHKNERVGRVYISLKEKDESPNNTQPFITVEINKNNRGKGIGTIVFQQASKLSGHKEVFAEMRKNNIASQIAATRAGYKPDQTYKGKQLRLVWTR